MKKVLLFLFLIVTPMFSQTGVVSGYCNLGATQANTSGLKSTNYLQGVIPDCTVKVYLTGTTTLATIYSDSLSTPLTNPFTANADASWLFYAATGQSYDIVLSGGTSPNVYSSPVTVIGVTPFWSNIYMTWTLYSQCVSGKYSAMSDGQGNAAGPIEARWLGAGLGVSNDAAILNAAFACGKTLGRSVHLADGTYIVKDAVLTIDSVAVRGDGPLTHIIQEPTVTTAPVQEILLTGTAPSLSNVAITSTYAYGRSTFSGYTGIAVVVQAATQATVDGVKISGWRGTGCTPGSGYSNCGLMGIIVDSSTDVHISNNRLQYTVADGIQITNGSSQVFEYGNWVDSPGDDCHSIVSYAYQSSPVSYADVHDNYCSNGLARSWMVDGGNHIDYHDNLSYGTADACIEVQAGSSYNTSDATYVTMSHNTCYGSTRRAAAFIGGNYVTSTSTAHIADHVKLDGNVLLGALGAATIGVGNPSSGTYSASNIELTNNTFDASATSQTYQFGIYINGAYNVSINGGSVENVSSYGLYSIGTNGGHLLVNGVRWNNISDVSAGHAVINISSGGAWKDAVFTNNSITNGTYSPGSFLFVPSDLPVCGVYGNAGDTFAVSGTLTMGTDCVGAYFPILVSPTFSSPTVSSGDLAITTGNIHMNNGSSAQYIYGSGNAAWLMMTGGNWYSSATASQRFTANSAAGSNTYGQEFYNGTTDLGGFQGTAPSTTPSHPFLFRALYGVQSPYYAVNGITSLTGCSSGSQTGGNTAGTFTSGVSGTCTVVITAGYTAPNGWACPRPSDLTTTADTTTWQQTASTQTTLTLSGTTVSGDVISWGPCVAY
jgi:hypothetical protein